MYLKDIPTDIVRLKESHGHRLRFLVYSIVCFVDYESLQCRDLSTLNEKYKDHNNNNKKLIIRKYHTLVRPLIMLSNTIV